jgi:large subunit ribosomal protein L22
MTGTKTNERPGTRAQVRHARFSASKARAVLDIIRGLPVDEAADVLQFTERGASEAIARCLTSAVANAQHNDELDGETLYVSACYADEGPTLKRWRPRARGRATRIRKRTCHITIIVSPMPEGMAAKVEAKRSAAPAAAGGRGGRSAREARRARVARSRRAEAAEQAEQHDHDHEGHDHEHDEPQDASPAAEATTTDQVVSDAVTSDADIEDKGAADAEKDED